jgi:hypothetical protein
MKYINSLLLTAVVAHDATKFSLDGVEVTITRISNGKEVPVELGPDLGRSSQRSSSTKRSVNRRTVIEFSENWCGMSNVDAPSGTTWTNVFGTWVVPEISLRDGQTPSETPELTQWVGIDGDTLSGDKCTGIIQGGTASAVCQRRTKYILLITECYADYNRSDS